MLGVCGTVSSCNVFRGWGVVAGVGAVIIAGGG